MYGTIGSSPSDGVAVWGENPSTNANAWAGYFNGKLKAVGAATFSSSLATTGAATFSSTLTVQGTPFANQTTFSLISDGRLKKNVEPLTGALDALLKLRGVTFEWKNPAEHDNQVGRQRGFIAQEVEKAIPDWVIQDPEGFKRLSLRGYEAMVVESIRTLKTENDSLRDRVRALENGRPVAVGLTGNGLLGLGLMVLGGAIIVSRRREQRVAPSSSIGATAGSTP